MQDFKYINVLQKWYELENSVELLGHLILKIFDNPDISYNSTFNMIDSRITNLLINIERDLFEE